MADPATATPAALDRLKLQLDTEQLTLLTAAGQAAEQAPTIAPQAIVLSSASSPSAIRQEIEAKALQDVSCWKATGDRVFMVFVPGFRAKGLVFEPLVKTQVGKMSDACIALDHATHILAGNASFFAYPASAGYEDLWSGVAPDLVSISGQAVRNGVVIKGNSAPARAHIRQQGAGLVAGKGDPPGIGTAGTNAIGGIVPMITSGTKLVARPKLDPDTRPWEEIAYGLQNKPQVGKTVVAYNTAWDMAAAVWEKDAQVTNFAPDLAGQFHSLDVIRDFLFDLGFDHAVSMDGSSSVFLYVYPTRTLHYSHYNAEWPLKDQNMPTAFAIRRPS